MRCPRCGGEIPSGAGRCPQCGASAQYGGNTEFFGKASSSNLKFTDIFSGVFRKHSKEEGERLFMAGTASTTPPESEMIRQWTKPWVFAWVAVIGVVLSLAAVLWFLAKDYPLDYQNGVLLVDPELMMEDGFMSAGMVLGFFPGWLIERRWLRFSTKRHSAGQIVLSLAALVPMLLIYKQMPGLLAGITGPLWACYLSCAFLAFYVTALVPAVLCLLQRRGILPQG